MSDFDPSTINEELPDDRALSSISTLAAEAKLLEFQVVEQTKKLRQLLARHRQVTEVDLPRAMGQAGARSFETDSGARVGLVTKFDAGQLVNIAGVNWVEANGGSSLIKTVLTVELDAGDYETAQSIYHELRAHRAANSFKMMTLNKTVHPQTIAKFARDLIDRGKDPPLQLLGVRPRTYAVVGKRPKTVKLNGFVDE